MTNNGADFLKLHGAQSLHSGLVVIVPNVEGALQQPRFRMATEQLLLSGEPINQVLEVRLDGEDVTFDSYGLPGAPLSGP